MVNGLPQVQCGVIIVMLKQVDLLMNATEPQHILL